MLNLSQLARESPDYPLVGTIISFRNPDIYLAENLVDYHQNAPSLEFPWYKRFPLPDKSMDRAYIVFKNVGLKKLNLDPDKPNWFVLHDDSGQELVYWNADHKTFPTMASFDQVQAKQGLKDDDWVYEVCVRYLIHSNLSSVVQVSRHRFSNRKLERVSLTERIMSLFPEFEPQWQPAF